MKFLQWLCRPILRFIHIKLSRFFNQLLDDKLNNISSQQSLKYQLLDDKLNNISSYQQHQNYHLELVSDRVIYLENIVTITQQLQYKKTTDYRILHILDKIYPMGGVESRMKNLQNCTVTFIILTDACHNPNYSLSKDFPYTIQLDYTDPFINNKLLNLVQFFQIDAVEFHFKDIDTWSFDSLKHSLHSLNVKMGCTLHTKFIQNCLTNHLSSWEVPQILSLFDYCINISPEIADCFSISNMHLLPHPIDTPLKDRKTPNNHKALLITRIDIDKKESICAFIEWCFLHSIEFDIMGDAVVTLDFKIWLENEYRLHPHQFIGKQNTIEYLINTDQYIFIAGIGQCILEAGSCGFPCLIAAYDGEIKGFITQKTISKFAKTNFTGRNIEALSKQDILAQLSQIKSSDINVYNIKDYIQLHHDRQTICNTYENLFKSVNI